MSYSRLLYSTILATTLLAVACSSVPDISYYSFPIEVTHSTSNNKAPSINITPLDANTIYNDNRMVYRTSPYRLNHYYYHRWSTLPPSLLSDYLRTELIRSGKFSHVTLGYATNSNLQLSGNLVSLDQIEYKGDWKAQVGISFTLKNQVDSKTLWSETVVREAPMHNHQPEAFAIASRRAMDEIISYILPIILQSNEQLHS